jgi:hypothetical protein
MYRGLIDIGRPGNAILWRIGAGFKHSAGLFTSRYSCSFYCDPIYTGGKSNELEFTA